MYTYSYAEMDFFPDGRLEQLSPIKIFDIVSILSAKSCSLDIFLIVKKKKQTCEGNETRPTKLGLEPSLAK